MKSFTGKFSSVRGWALLLALLLGAGMIISACGEEEVPAPTTPAPAPAPTPPPAPEPEPTGPATPENLRVTGTTSTSITWSWNAVEGAIGYQGQFSTDATFTETDPTFIIVAPATSHTVSNLGGSTTGHFRVRSGTGTALTDLTYSEWTDGVSGTTAAPPPATALAAPDNVELGDRNDDSITLEWDRVADAATYEVEQREPGDDWGDAACGADDADNVVDDEECVASGLDSGTDYDFRVRGVPADDDDANLVGAWSETFEARTTGTAAPEPTAPVGGGMGNLNVRWTSGGDTPTISWTWDRLSGKTYDWVVITSTSTPGLPRMDAENPCADRIYAQTDDDRTNATSTASPALLCVKTTNQNNNSENLSFAWAVLPPAAPAAPAAAGVSPAETSAMATRSLTWTGIGVAAGFSYEMNVIADPERDNRITSSPVSPTGSALQRACSAGTLLESDETDVPLTGLETTLRTVKPYTGYLLCLRMLNSSGATDWVVPASNAEHYTVPGQAPRPTKDSSRSEDDRTATSEKIVWNVATRNNMNVPRGDGTFADLYNLKVIKHPDRNDGDDDDVLHDDRIARPTARTCGDDDFDSSPYDTSITPTTALTSDGFTVTIATVTRPTAEVRVGGTDTTPTMAILSEIVTLCIQAKHGTRLGPWNASSPETIEKANPSS